MRSTKFTTVQRIQKTSKPKKCGTIFALYTPNQIIIKPGENAEVKTQVKVELPCRKFVKLK